MLEEKPNREGRNPFNNGILKKGMILNYLSVKVDLNGDRIISSLKVLRSKYEAPILAEKRKNIDTERIDRNVNIHNVGVKRLTRFQAGDISCGNLENQY